VLAAEPSTRFDVTLFSSKGFGAGQFVPSIVLDGNIGELRTVSVPLKLGPYDDYAASWAIVGKGAIVADDIRIIDVATGRVIAAENGDTPIQIP